MTYKDSETHIISPRDLLKGLSTQDFLNFGIQQIAYIRPVTLQGSEAYAVHAADGTPLSVMDTLDSALMAVKQNDLEAVVLH